MARNALDQIWGERRYVHIADLFLQTDYAVAGILAGRELECYIRRICEEKRIPTKFINDSGYEQSVPIRHLTKQLFNRGVIYNDEKRSINRWWDIRCDLVHEESPLVEEAEVRSMVSGIIDFLRQ